MFLAFLIFLLIYSIWLVIGGFKEAQYFELTREEAYFKANKYQYGMYKALQKISGMEDELAIPDEMLSKQKAAKAKHQKRAKFINRIALLIIVIFSVAFYLEPSLMYS
jgi:uncharacterized membrane protein YgcG